MPAVNELLKLLPYLGSAAGGFVQGDQLRLQREDAASKRGLAQGEAERAAEADARERDLHPLQREKLIADTEATRGRSSRDQRQHEIDTSPVTKFFPPEVLAAYARTRSKAGAPGDPKSYEGMTTKQFLELAGITPLDPTFLRAETERKELLLARYREIERAVRTSLTAKTPIDALIEGRIRENPEDAKLLDEAYAKGDLQGYLQTILAKIQALEGQAAAPAGGGETAGSIAAPGAGGLTPAQIKKNAERAADGLPPLYR